MLRTEAEIEEYRRMHDQTHYISSVDKIPQTSHFIVLQDESQSYPSSYGEQYGNDTCSYMKYIAFDSEEALQYWVLQQAKDKSFYHKAYKVFKIIPVEVELHTSVKLKA